MRDAGVAKIGESIEMCIVFIHIYTGCTVFLLSSSSSNMFCEYLPISPNELQQYDIVFTVGLPLCLPSQERLMISFPRLSISRRFSAECFLFFFSSMELFAK